MSLIRVMLSEPDNQNKSGSLQKHIFFGDLFDTAIHHA